MSTTVALTCALIVLGRALDVSLGTIRMLFIVQGEKLIAATLGFFEILIWVLIVSRVVTSLEEPAYFVAYAAGFSVGTYLGMLIEGKIASGRQVVRIFTRQGASIAQALRANGYVVTEFAGQGRDGEVSLLFLETSRRSAKNVLATLRSLDPEAYPIVDDVRAGAVRVASKGGAWHWLGVRRK